MTPFTTGSELNEAQPKVGISPLAVASIPNAVVCERRCSFGLDKVADPVIERLVCFAEGAAKDIGVGEATGQVKEGVESLLAELPTRRKNTTQHFQAAKVTFDQDPTRPVRDAFPVTNNDR